MKFPMSGMNYEDVQLLSQEIEAGEIKAQSRGGSRSALDVVGVYDILCDSCGDGCRANCADTLSTFSAMHADQNCSMTVMKLS